MGSLRPYRSLVLAVCLCLTLTALAARHFRTVEETAARHALEAAVDERFHEISLSLAGRLHGVGALSAFLASVPVPDPEQFQLFVAGMRRLHPHIQALARLSWKPGAGESLGSLSVDLIGPADGEESALGLDIAAVPACREALARARDTGRLTLTGRVSVPGPNANWEGVLAVEPVYRPGKPLGTVEERRARLEAFALGFFRVGSLVGDPIASLLPAGMEVHVEDESAEPAGRFLFHLVAPAAAASHHPRDDEAHRRRMAGLSEASSQTRTLIIGNRTWKLIFFAAPGGVAGAGRSVALAWVLGILGTTAFALFLFVRLRHEQALAAGEARLRELAETVPDVLYRRDARDFSLIYVSPQVEALLGRSPGDLLAAREAWEQHVAEGQWPRLRAQAEASLRRHAEGYQLSYRVTDRAGTTRWVDDRGRIRHDASGRPVEIVGCLTDVTDCALTTQALRASEAKYRIVADNTFDWEYWIDPEGTYRYCSPSCERITGYPPADFVADPGLLARIIHPHDLPRYLEHKSHALHQGPAEELEFRLVARDGGVRWVSHFCLPLFDADGRFVGRRGSNYDVTERRRAGEQLRRLNEDLEQRVLERTARLEAVNRELESFSYSVSHDLRAPLRTIASFSAILIEGIGGPMDGEGRTVLERIRACVARMETLIDDLLRLSRIGRSEVRRRPVDLSALARGIAAELQGAEPGREATFTIAPGLQVEADPDLARIALENLLRNAWKFTRKRPGARIEVGAETGSHETAYFVRDNGAGFDMRYAGRLFAPFQRLHGQNEFEGTGIGLSIVQRVVMLHGGRVWAESAVDRGATFRFTLPRLAREEATAA